MPDTLAFLGPDSDRPAPVGVPVKKETPVPEAPEITDQAPVWVVWINTDLTEGRGHERAVHTCQKEATARRLAHKAGVQGSDARITEERNYCINNRWYGIVHALMASKEDDREQQRIDAKRAAVQKALDRGLTDDEIAAIQGGRG